MPRKRPFKEAPWQLSGLSKQTSVGKERTLSDMNATNILSNCSSYLNSSSPNNYSSPAIFCVKNGFSYRCADNYPEYFGEGMVIGFAFGCLFAIYCMFALGEIIKEGEETPRTANTANNTENISLNERIILNRQRQNHHRNASAPPPSYNQLYRNGEV
jgi:hypothetical protein